jgi:acyl CoA:acetate/3-ketoacid CoA transferase
MPGIDIQKDIVNAGGARFIIPDHIVPGVAPEIVSGKGFSLKFENP